MNHWADYVIFAIFIAISLGIGLFHALTGGRQKTTEEFIMADRSLKVIPTAISLLVSYQSAIMIIGFTAELYTGGTEAWFMTCVAYVVSILISALVVLPWIYKLRLTSVYNFFLLRYGTRDVQSLAAIMGVLGAVTYMATATLAPSIALETATGFPSEASIPIMALVCIIYTSLGGIKAVIWTDVFQFAIMLGGMITVMIKAFIEDGGVKTAFDLLDSQNRLNLANFSPDPTVRHTFWAFLFGWSTVWVSIYGIGQGSVQRYSAVKTMKEARLVLLLNMPAVLVMTSISYLTGVGVVGYFTKMRCDPLAEGVIGKSNELLPWFVKNNFKGVPGFNGLFLATLYSGALSSVSSSLSAAAAITWDDLLKCRFPQMPESRAIKLNKLLVIIYGVISVGIAFGISFMSGPILQISIGIGSAVTGPLTGLFILGSLRVFSFCRSRCVVLGGIVGTALSLWLIVSASSVKQTYAPLPPLPTDQCVTGLNFTTAAATTLADITTTQVTAAASTNLTGLQRFYSLSYLYYTIFGLVVTVLVSVILSIILNCIKKPETRDVPEGVFLSFSFRRSTGKYEMNETELSEMSKVLHK